MAAQRSRGYPENRALNTRGNVNGNETAVEAENEGSVDAFNVINNDPAPSTSDQGVDDKRKSSLASDDLNLIKCNVVPSEIN